MGPLELLLIPEVSPYVIETRIIRYKVVIFPASQGM